MLKTLITLLSLTLITSCTPDYSDITEITELLIAKGYHNIEYKYAAGSNTTEAISALCNYSTTLVFTVKDSNNQVKNLAVCMDTKKIHLLSQVLN